MISDNGEYERRKKKAIDLFVSVVGGKYQSLSETDVSYKVFNKNGELYAYVEVIPVMKVMKSAYPLPVRARDLVKLIDKRFKPILLWSCDDGVIYGNAEELEGKFCYKKNRQAHLTGYFDKQWPMKYIRFT